MRNTSRVAGTVEVTITASPARLSLQPGLTSDVYAYNGTIPGPTLVVNEGDRVIVHFRNNLAEASTIHWHGLHIPFDQDGSPFHPVEPGAQHDYVFTIPRGTAGTYWYHPHPHHGTGHQVAKGLYGGIIVRAADDPLPRTLTEKLFVLSDNRFIDGGTVDIPAMHSHAGRVDLENGREGNVLFVNGQVMPTVAIRSGEIQRWRLINASAARVYRLSLGGQPFLHVGNDGGLFEKPLEVKEIVIANGERVELLVRGTEAPGSRTVFQTLPYDRYIPQTRPTDWKTPRDLFTLQYSSQAPVPSPKLPAMLRPIPAIDTATATATRVMVLTQHLINGKKHDMERIDVSSRVGATEIWQVENLVGMDHPFHLHGFQFQVLDRNGVPEKFRSWKDMVNVPKHETARFIVRYTDFPGKWMFHCHILDHEDHGMMGILEVK
ncbi:MAG TPA: multicopper oxidase family protein [Gemmatimonadaceae bacterium]|nr:multicopper oxidase family protein [Gemmatimonadaceae bacterium]